MLRNAARCNPELKLGIPLDKFQVAWAEYAFEAFLSPRFTPNWELLLLGPLIFCLHHFFYLAFSVRPDAELNSPGCLAIFQFQVIA